MKKYCVTVEIGVEVTLDETKFTEEWMKEFRDDFYPIYDMEGHAKHIAQMAARGIYNEGSTFVEGYGETSEMGITIKTDIDIDEDVESVEDI
jgi:hypothetical protein